jgi:hypothetical protein
MTHEHPYAEEAGLLYTSIMLDEISRGYCYRYQYLYFMRRIKSAEKKTIYVHILLLFAHYTKHQQK